MTYFAFVSGSVYARARFVLNVVFVFAQYTYKYVCNVVVAGVLLVAHDFVAPPVSSLWLC